MVFNYIFLEIRQSLLTKRTINYKIPYNKPFLVGKELEYIKEAIESGKISGNGQFTRKCQQFFEERFGFGKCLLTSSCTDALEMCALLLDIKEGDEIIMPSYTFVSTANAFMLRGAKIVFADSSATHPNMTADIEALITPKTKAIVVVHYAGMACDMEVFGELAKKHQLYLIEDAAHALDSYHLGKPLGGIGHLATFSFHETKNIIAGEGGMLVVNDEALKHKAEIIWEKGTNRSAFFRGEVAKYNWVSLGSSFLPSEITAAFLFAQLESFDEIPCNSKYFRISSNGFLARPPKSCLNKSTESELIFPFSGLFAPLLINVFFRSKTLVAGTMMFQSESLFPLLTTTSPVA